MRDEDQLVAFEVQQNPEEKLREVGVGFEAAKIRSTAQDSNTNLDTKSSTSPSNTYCIYVYKYVIYIVYVCIT